MRRAAGLPHRPTWTVRTRCAHLRMQCAGPPNASPSRRRCVRALGPGQREGGRIAGGWCYCRTWHSAPCPPRARHMRVCLDAGMYGVQWTPYQWVISHRPVLRPLSRPTNGSYASACLCQRVHEHTKVPHHVYTERYQEKVGNNLSETKSWRGWSMACVSA